MHVVVRTSGGDADVSITGSRDDDRLADLIQRVTGDAVPSVVTVDGRTLPSDTTLDTAGLLTGCVVSTTSDPDEAPGHLIGTELAQVAGPGAGAVASLLTGRFVVGRSRHPNAADLSEAAVHTGAIEVHVAADRTVSVRSVYPDAPAKLDGDVLPWDRFQTWTAGWVTVSDRVFELRQRSVAGTGSRRRFSALSNDGQAAFNRPPRPAVEEPGRPIEVPEGGRVVGERRRFPLLAMIAPLPIAVGMALLLGSPRFMLFGLMSPIMAGANWLSDRRDRKRQLGESVRADAAATAEFTVTADREFVRERTRRRAAHPHLADVATMAAETSPELWQRRAGDPDVFEVAVGVADRPWEPTLERSSGSLSSADSIVAALGPMCDVPVTVDLLGERGVGFVGSDDFNDAAVRGLLLGMTTTHGPADLDVVVLTTPARAVDWEWVKWLPHSRIGGSPRIYVDDEQVRGWAAAVRAGWERPARPTAPSHVTMVVLDDPRWWRDRTAAIRPLLADASMPLRFVVLTTIAEDLPAVCTTVVSEGTEAVASIDYLTTRRRVDDVRPFHASLELAERCARNLAPLDDPELPAESATALPSTVPILQLLGLDEPDASSVVQRWQRAGRPARPVVQLGVGERGVVEIDLVDDGPHGLIAGTTGAGKSELLRSLVVGLAANLQPDDVNFVLVDFKGGSAFDACADLPHTVGLVTDLDEHLAGRVLRCLQAELHHREVVLRGEGASSLREYQLTPGVAPLPRLVLVVDEFASVAAELPEFLPALVDIAQRGRSLGIHMILATQRPAGVVDNKIKANTNLRIALRVQDDGDSLDVINTKDAALLPRQVPGRAFARFGAGELTMFQSAYASGVSSGDDVSGIEVHPFVVGRALTVAEERMVRMARRASQSMTATDGHVDPDTDLARLVGSIRQAAADVGQTEQRRPYPDPLPDDLPLADVLAAHRGTSIPFAMVDLPDEQRQIPRHWQPGPDGSMIIYGITGAGTSSVLVSLALGVAQRCSPDDVHLYVIDADANVLDPLAALPHTGAVIRLDELDRVVRLTRFLAAEIERRKRLAIDLGGPAAVVRSQPSVVIMIDNVGALRGALDDSREYEGAWSELERVLRDGQSLGLCAVLTAKQERAVPTSLAAQIPERLVMRLGDQFGYAGFGFRPVEVPEFVPGRALRPDDKTEMQVCRPPVDIAAAIVTLDLVDAPTRPARRIDPLPTHVDIDEIIHAARADDRSLVLPVGIDTRTGDPAVLVVPFGEAALVTGAPGTGRSSVLAALARGVAAADPTLARFAVAPRGGPLARVEGVDRPSSPADVADWVERVITGTGRRVVLLDDADRLGGPSFEKLAAARDDDLIVVFAGRADDLRQLTNWTKPMQRFRNGVLLRPTATDGELLRVSLGHRLPRFDVHHGVVSSDGDVTPLLAADAASRPTAADQSVSTDR